MELPVDLIRMVDVYIDDKSGRKVNLPEIYSTKILDNVIILEVWIAAHSKISK